MGRPGGSHGDGLEADPSLTASPRPQIAVHSWLFDEGRQRVAIHVPILPAVPTPTASTEAALSIATLRRDYREAFAPRPFFYWCDLLASAGIGWSAFFLALTVESLPWALVASGIALLALYRAVLFIHELTHLKAGALPGFEAAWHVAVGFPMLAPSLLYVGSHGDHHRQAVYGTAGDPEYDTLADWAWPRLLASSLALVVVPAALILRWGLLGPLSWVLPPLRRFVIGRLSTLVINPAYRRRRPSEREQLRWRSGELGGALVVWGVVALVSQGVFSVYAVYQWYGIMSGILLLNHVRTLAAHRYRSGGEAQDQTGELLDSVNLVGSAPLMALLAPVGLRFHALHHFAPTLPYHSLGAVHRALERKLPEGSPYRRAEVRGLVTALSRLLRHGEGSGARAA